VGLAVGWCDRFRGLEMVCRLEDNEDQLKVESRAQDTPSKLEQPIKAA